MQRQVIKAAAHFKIPVARAGVQTAIQGVQVHIAVTGLDVRRPFDCVHDNIAVAGAQVEVSLTRNGYFNADRTIHPPGDMVLVNHPDFHIYPVAVLMLDNFQIVWDLPAMGGHAYPNLFGIGADHVEVCIISHQAEFWLRGYRKGLVPVVAKGECTKAQEKQGKGENLAHEKPPTLESKIRTK